LFTFDARTTGQSGRRLIQDVGVLVRRKPDLMLILLAIFGLGVAVTLLAPISSSRSVAEPVSALHSGVITQPE